MIHTVNVHKSSYQKPRLSVTWVRNALADAGLTVAVERAGRLTLLSAVSAVDGNKIVAA